MQGPVAGQSEVTMQGSNRSVVCELTTQRGVRRAATRTVGMAQTSQTPPQLTVVLDSFFKPSLTLSSTLWVRAAVSVKSAPEPGLPTKKLSLGPSAAKMLPSGAVMTHLCERKGEGVGPRGGPGRGRGQVSGGSGLGVGRGEEREIGGLTGETGGCPAC
jgi:hypothetical protein